MNQPLDREALMDRMGGDEELISMISRQFLDDCDPLMVGIRGALDSKDAKALMHHAHTLKGSVGNFSADPTYQAAYKLESMGRDSEWDGSEEAWQVLDSALTALKPELEKLCACSV